MKVIAISGSRNPAGQTARATDAFLDGVRDKRGEVEHIFLPQLDIQSCRQCEDNGWGRCREEGVCVIEDDFAATRQAVLDADAWVLVTPVYFGELSECVKAFADRLRRCNIGAKGEGLKEKPVIGVAAAGGSGRGTATCLLEMDRLFSHISAQIADLIAFLRADKVEVRLYDKGFLHAKAYLFHQDEIGAHSRHDRHAQG